MKRLLLNLLSVLTLLALFTANLWAQSIAVWADGDPSSDGGNGIFAFINSLPGFSATMVTTAQLATPGYLTDNGFSALYITRFDAAFGSGLSPTAAANVADYVSKDGAVVLFMNDWDDNLPTSFSGDPPDTLTSELIANGIALAAGSGHGYVGEFNGGAMGLAANANGFPPLSFFPGTAGPLGGFTCQGVTITDAGAVIQGDVPTTFTPADISCFRTAATGVPSDSIYATYADGAPAIVGSALSARPAVPRASAPTTGSKK